MTETPMISSPPASARVRPMRSTTRPIDEHERVHADHVGADDREHRVPGVVLVVDDDRAGQRHHPHHHGERRLAREQRRDHPGAAHDLAQRRRGRQRALGVAAQQLGDPHRVGPHGEHEHERRRA